MEFIVIGIILIVVVGMIGGNQKYAQEELKKKKKRERKQKERETAKLPRNKLEAAVIEHLRLLGWQVSAVNRKKYDEPTDIGWIAKKEDTLLTLTISEKYRISRDMVLNALIGHEDFVSDHAVIISKGLKMTPATQVSVDVGEVICLEPDGIEYLSGSF